MGSQEWAWTGGGRAQTAQIKVGISDHRVFGSSSWEQDMGLTDRV